MPVCYQGCKYLQCSALAVSSPWHNAVLSVEQASLIHCWHPVKAPPQVQPAAGQQASETQLVWATCARMCWMLLPLLIQQHTGQQGGGSLPPDWTQCRRPKLTRTWRSTLLRKWTR